MLDDVAYILAVDWALKFCIVLINCVQYKSDSMAFPLSLIGCDQSEWFISGISSYNEQYGRYKNKMSSLQNILLLLSIPS